MSKLGNVIELVVSKGKTLQVSDKEWLKTEFSVKATIDHNEELAVAKAQIEGVIDGWLANMLPPSRATTGKREAQPSLPGSENLSVLPWKSYQTKQAAKEDETAWIFADAEGAEALLASLKAKGKVQIGKFEYSLRQGKDKSFISRKPLK